MWFHYVENGVRAVRRTARDNPVLFAFSLGITSVALTPLHDVRLSTCGRLIMRVRRPDSGTGDVERRENIFGESSVGLMRCEVLRGRTTLAVHPRMLLCRRYRVVETGEKVERTSPLA